MTKLEGVHPALIRAVNRMRNALAELGCPVVVTQGVRTVEQQQALYAKGRTAPGAIVTYADGIIKKSNHQPAADGLGRAVDLAFLDADGKPSWDESHPWTLLGVMAEQQGLQWGGRWKKPVDRPHVELP